MSSEQLPPFEKNKGFKISTSPNPDWKYGQRIEETPEGRAWAEGEKAGWTVVDTSKEETRRLYAIGIAGIVPRPIAFVSSVSKDGVENLAPFSWFNQVCPNPFVVSFSCAHGGQKGVKDTLANVLSGAGFTINIISEPWIEQSNVCSTDAPLEVSEWPISGLTKVPSIHVKAPRVKESAFSMECELLQTVEVKDPATNNPVSTLVLAQVKYIHMRNDILDPVRGLPDPAKYKPMARMGGLTYARVSEGFALPRPPWDSMPEDVKQRFGGAADSTQESSSSSCSNSSIYAMPAVQLPPFDLNKGFKYTSSPVPTWRYGQSIESTPEGKAWAEGEKAGWTVIDPTKETARRMYAITVAGIAPRPIAFISSISQDGVENLAPFSWFNMVTPDPPVITFGVSHVSGAAKDTLRNVLAGTGFTVNIISAPWVEQSHICSAVAPPDVSEWPISGLTKAPSILVKAARVKESAFSMECELFHTVEIRSPVDNVITSTLVVAHVKYIHMRNDVLDPVRGIPDPAKLKPVAKMGGLSYAVVTEGFTLPRAPSWETVAEGQCAAEDGAIAIPPVTSSKKATA
ncbi:hypothetical protein CVT25_009913 [Psilocybe cyanescens]|uniref:Flavin reductase like domain-containing protein n=1 Tax=Psilocybe cyanescens TaxID=93625 RepID=A0A409XCN0_PSICY|nr:hypothetical protein CVT25_009913 [Psilocybe cyanescens]